MNALTVIFIAVLDRLWQAVLLAGIAWLAMHRTSRVNAATRFAIWWAVLVVVLMLPFATSIVSVARHSTEPTLIDSARVTASSIGWFTTPIASRCRVIRCGRAEERRVCKENVARRP